MLHSAWPLGRGGVATGTPISCLNSCGVTSSYGTGAGISCIRRSIISCVACSLSMLYLREKRELLCACSDQLTVARGQFDPDALPVHSSGHKCGRSTPKKRVEHGATVWAACGDAAPDQVLRIGGVVRVGKVLGCHLPDITHVPAA